MWQRNAAFAPLLKQYAEDFQKLCWNSISHHGPDIDPDYYCRYSSPIPAAGRDLMKRPAPQGEKAGLHTVVKINRVCVLPMMPSMVMASSIQRPHSTIVAGINWYIPLAQPDDWYRHEKARYSGRDSGP
jgi:hypothetical protein